VNGGGFSVHATTEAMAMMLAEVSDLQSVGIAASLTMSDGCDLGVGRMSLAEVAEQSSAAFTAHEADIVPLFAQAFDLPTVGLDDDFFQIGGDSLIGETLMALIESRFGIILSMSTLLEAPTPRALARVVYDRNSERIARYVIRVKPEGVQPPIFCVHGANGESTAPHALSALVPDRQFFAFRAIGLEEGERIQTRLEEIASTYIAGIAAVHKSSSPVIILGHCAGAIIALEMAHQLAVAGEPPLGLILIDPADEMKRAPYLHITGLGLSIERTKTRQHIEDYERLLAEKEGKLTGAERRQAVGLLVDWSSILYTPRPYDGETLMFYSPTRAAGLLNKQRGFQTFIRNLETADLRTDHDDMFEGGLPQIEAALKNFISRVAGSNA
jgi:thioesterase domain-containing protein/acyl carrier protein